MDKLQNRLWIVFFFLFIFWYFLLYSFDFISFPAFSVVSRSQNAEDDDSGDSSPSVISGRSDSKFTESDGDDDKSHGYTSFSDYPEDPAIDHNPNASQPSNVAEALPENDPMPDIESLEKELEAEQLRHLKPSNDPLIPAVDRQNPSDGGDVAATRSTIPVAVDSGEKEKEPEPELKADRRRGRKPCAGRWIYIQKISTKFNDDYVKQCKEMNQWHDMCPYFENSGLGPRLGNPQRLFTTAGWYDTHQFSLEVIFHNAMREYECLTDDPSQAAAIFVPYYPGLDVARHLWGGHTNAVKDADAVELFRWLQASPEWQAMNGRDHFMVSGRIAWDTRRESDDADAWGSKLMLLPESRNITFLTIESSPWDKNDFAIPYPTYFHPSNDDQVYTWQRRMRRRRRKTLFCFAGAPRPNMENSIRGEIMQQCVGATRRRCQMLECKDEKKNCLKPSYVMRMFESSIFCLQPPGDSFTRRSTFDAIISGCIPVFFTPGSAYVQYLWHLPKDFTSYSVLIPEQDVKNKRVSIERVLSRIPKAKVAAMRAEVIKLIPNVIYADPRSRLDRVEDAFDLAVQGVVKRVDGLRKEMNERRQDDENFDPEESWKYYTFGTTKPHEWDHFFNRSQMV
ncbi:probable xyloglucan galactosyltransferase GT14 [Andrographis paniculata]|uniref:probable xyloglucan galactosyltransferase GT14 n=1 Tax=Andrographis paniculata TaxID=175694 RepID=UPI0021E7C5A6|nr:probable xyloglucan galactosyltransferase GT14 [Andrographis paniculata]